MFYPTSPDIENTTILEVPPTTLEKHFKGLAFYTQYSFQIRAVNDFNGEWSTVMKRFTDPNGQFLVNIYYYSKYFFFFEVHNKQSFCCMASYKKQYIEASQMIMYYYF